MQMVRGGVPGKRDVGLSQRPAWSEGWGGGLFEQDDA